MRKKVFNAIKLGNTDVFYKSSEWINKRKDILNRDNKECQRCKKARACEKKSVNYKI